MNTDAISMEWIAVTGHYRKPGAVETMQTAQSYPFVPLSTCAGALESFCGKEFGDFKASGSEMAAGWIRRPLGRGTLLRLEQGFANQKAQEEDEKKSKEGWRPIKREALFYMSYRFDVRGPYVELIRRALLGDVDRFGVMSLGDSDDMVDWVCETSKPAEWLIPGNEFLLPLRVQRSWNKLASELMGFQFSESLSNPPDNAWYTPGGTP